MNNIKVTKQFVEYSKKLAEDILGYNRCFSRGHMDNERNKKLIYHIKRCEKLLDEMEKQYMNYIKRGIKVSLCFYGNSQTKYFMNGKMNLLLIGNIRSNI